MEVTPLEIPEILKILPKKFQDNRGFFSEAYNQTTLAQHGITCNFVQDNHSLSRPAGTLRGLHFQVPPFEQSKLVRVTRGSIFDVAVDLRNGSPTFGKHVSLVLSADNWTQIFIPPGFAHAFVTLEPDTEVIYKVDKLYAPQYDAGVRWDDPDIAIAWPALPGDVILSNKDARLPWLRDIRSPFAYDGSSK